MAPPRPPSQVAEVQTRHAGRLAAILLLALIILTAVIVIIIWLAVQPKKVEYSIERGAISRYNLTDGGGGGGSHLSATFHFLLRAKNPNKRVSFYYDRIDVTALYLNQRLFVGKVDPFYQRRRNVTDLELNVAAEDVVVRGEAAEDLKRERESGDIKLEVRISAKIRLKLGLIKVHRSLEARCGPFSVPFSSSKVFNRASCDVDISD